ncbi:unknown [Eubacterium sp. CAG:786]|nr:unknown [Eubacterium sp. CAG:786]
MKQAAFVLGIIATILSVIATLGVAWLYIEKKVRYITTDDNVQ